MTFTQYLHHLVALGLAPSFSELLESGLWPDESARLEDYERLLHTHVDASREGALLELRSLWSRWVEGPAISADLHADFALSVWRDYAVHLRTCELREVGLCPRAEALLARAIEESHFHNLAAQPADSTPCEDPEAAEARVADSRWVNRILEVPGVEDLIHQRHIQSCNQPSTPVKH